MSLIVNETLRRPWPKHNTCFLPSYAVLSVYQTGNIFTKSSFQIRSSYKVSIMFL